jgi:hypothetical protein
MKTFVSILTGLSMFVFVSCEWINDIFSPEDISTHEKGDTVWVHQLPDDLKSIRTPGNLFLAFALGENDVYYGAGGYSPTQIYAVNRKDGTLRWKTNELDHIDLSSQIVVGDDGTVYAIGYFKLYAIDPANGSFKWVWEVPETVPHADYPNGLYTYEQIGALALANNGDLILGSIGSGVYHRALYCINKNGNTKWFNIDAVAGSVGTGIVIGKNGNAFYYTNINAKNVLAAVNIENGAVIWTKEILSCGSSANNIVIDEEGNLVCSFADVETNEYHLHVIDAIDGSVLWQSDFISSTQKKLIGPDGYYYHYLDNNVDKHGVYRIAAYSNNFTLTNWGLYVGAIDNQNRLLYSFTDKDDYNKVKLGIFNTDATVDWSVQINSLRNIDYLISSDKIIYGVVGNNQVIAIQGDASLAASGWPKLAHDNRNTSNWSKH